MRYIIIFLIIFCLFSLCAEDVLAQMEIINKMKQNTAGMLDRIEKGSEDTIEELQTEVRTGQKAWQEWLRKSAEERIKSGFKTLVDFFIQGVKEKIYDVLNPLKNWIEQGSSWIREKAGAISFW